MSQSKSLSPEVRRFLEGAQVGVVSTIRPDGKARQSVTYFLLRDDRILISTESKRAKAQDVDRTGWASICVVGHTKPFASVTVEGSARILRTGIAGASAEIFGRIQGGDPPELTDEMLESLDRVILEISVDRFYGASYLDK
jgi:PPOX class probable F420-dependent enzyme